MDYKFVRAFYLEPRMVIFRRITDYSFAEEEICRVEKDRTDVFIFIEGYSGYAIKAQDDHVFMVKEIK